MLFDRKRFDYESDYNEYSGITLKKIKRLHWDMKGNKMFCEIDKLEVGGSLTADIRRLVWLFKGKPQVYSVKITRTC